MGFKINPKTRFYDRCCPFPLFLFVNVLVNVAVNGDTWTKVCLSIFFIMFVVLKLWHFLQWKERFVPFLWLLFSHPVKGITKFQLCILKKYENYSNVKYCKKNTCSGLIHIQRLSATLFRMSALTDLLVNRPIFDIFLFTYI